MMHSTSSLASPNAQHQHNQQDQQHQPQHQQPHHQQNQQNQQQQHSSRPPPRHTGPMTTRDVRGSMDSTHRSDGGSSRTAYPLSSYDSSSSSDQTGVGAGSRRGYTGRSSVASAGASDPDSRRGRYQPRTSTAGHRNSIFSRMSSAMGATGDGEDGGAGRASTLRDTFFGPSRPDPLLVDAREEFSLTVIDERGAMPEPIGAIITPTLHYNTWTRAEYTVVAMGAAIVGVTFLATLLVTRIDGYSIDPGFVFGSLQTLLLDTIVFVTYHGVQSYQAHPNPIILCKCVVDIFLALRFLLDPLMREAGVYTLGDRPSCATLSGVTQALYFASDSWYFALIVDLYRSLTNPFTSVKSSRREFMAFVVLTSVTSGIVAYGVDELHGFADGNYCWTHRGDSNDRDFWRLNLASWVLFYDWMIVYYLSGFAVLVYGVKRLRSGLQVTLETRRGMLRNGAISIISYTIYWTLAFTWYAVSFSSPSNFEKLDDEGRKVPSKVFRSYAYTVAGRGMVDYFVWFMINKPSLITTHWLKFSHESVDTKFSAQLNTALQRELIFFTVEGMTKAVQLADEELERSRTRSPTQELVLGVDDDGELDSYDQRQGDYPFERPTRGADGNIASGYTDPVSDRTIGLPPVSNHGQDHRQEEDGEESEELKTGSSSVSDETLQAHRRERRERREAARTAAAAAAQLASDPRAIPEEFTHSGRQSFLSRLGFSHPSAPPTRPQDAYSPARYTSEQHIKFTPYKSEAFADLRSACGIQTAEFLKSFQTSTKPSISEGASGAFMFFSGDNKYIVKSMAESECRFLCEITDDYVEYLITHPWSLITKFYGCFKITMYEKKFYFVVMENLFQDEDKGDGSKGKAQTGATPMTIHHRYDIKGSWISRSYNRPRRGAKVKCRHCSMQFKYGAKKAQLQCPNVVGLHEPNVVLKDNDLRTRMRIGGSAGKELFEHLRDDSLFLRDLGIMDYSLLLGVTDIEFMVDPPHASSSSRSNTVTSVSTSSRGSALVGPRSSNSIGSVATSEDMARTVLQEGRSDSRNPTTLSMVATSEAPSSLNFNDHSFADSDVTSTMAMLEASMRDDDDDGCSERDTTLPSATAMVQVRNEDHASHANSSKRSRGNESSSSSSSSRGTRETRTVSIPQSASEPRLSRSMRKSERVFGPGYYYIGVIDILQEWNTRKRLERFWKVYVKRSDADGISAVEPRAYQARFEAKLREIIAIPKESQRAIRAARQSRHFDHQDLLRRGVHGATEGDVNDSATNPPRQGDYGSGHGNGRRFVGLGPHVDEDGDDSTSRRSTTTPEVMPRPVMPNGLSTGTAHEMEDDDEDEDTGIDLEQSSHNPQPILMQLHDSRSRLSLSNRSLTRNVDAV